MFTQYELGELGEIITGKTPKKSNADNYGTADVPFIKPDDLTKGTIKTITVTNEFVSNEGAATGRVVGRGTVLVTCIGIIGKVGIVEVDNAIFNQQINAIIPNENIVLSKYLAYVLHSMQKQLQDKANAPIVPIINKTDFSKVKIRIPNLEYQRKVVSLLDEAKTIIDKRQSQITTLDELTQSLFLEMFGDPKLNNKNWDVYSFSDIVVNHNHLRVPLKDADRKKIQGKYPYYGATGIVDYINQYKFSGEYLLISEDGKALESRNKPIAFIASGDFWVNNHAHVVTASEKTNIRYLERYIESIDISNFVTGIDQYKLNKNNLNKIPINCPPIEMQDDFALKVAAIQEKKQALEKSLDKYNEFYESLLQKAFKGELYQD